MKKASTLTLRAAVITMGLCVLALCAFILPVGIAAEDASGYRPILIGMYLPAIPFFIALYHILKLLRYIDTEKTFSELSITSLRYIKFCSLVISGLYALGLPYIFIVADNDDAPGMVLIGLLFTLAPFAVAVFAAVLEKFFSDALRIKSENELTV